MPRKKKVEVEVVAEDSNMVTMYWHVGSYLFQDEIIRQGKFKIKKGYTEDELNLKIFDEIFDGDDLFLRCKNKEEYIESMKEDYEDDWEFHEEDYE